MAGPQGGPSGGTEVQMKNLPILHNFVPYRGRYQKKANSKEANTREANAKEANFRYEYKKVAQ